jgi:hypothetical protein
MVRESSVEGKKRLRFYLLIHLFASFPFPPLLVCSLSLSLFFLGIQVLSDNLPEPLDSALPLVTTRPAGRTVSKLTVPFNPSILLLGDFNIVSVLVGT